MIEDTVSVVISSIHQRISKITIKTLHLERTLHSRKSQSQATTLNGGRAAAGAAHHPCRATARKNVEERQPFRILALL